MILFSQNPTSHSRLGNSLAWMYKFIDCTLLRDRKFVFPWAIENFEHYLDSQSPWLNREEQLYHYFYRTFDKPLTASTLSDISRRLEAKFEVENDLKPFNWTQIVLSVIPGELLFLSGNIRISEDHVASEIASHKFVIAHEPWRFDFGVSVPSDNAVSSIAPSRNLFDSHLRFIEHHSQHPPRVGLHIRRGDYLRWEEGDYFYSDRLWLYLSRGYIQQSIPLYAFAEHSPDNIALIKKLIALGVSVAEGSFEQDFVRMMHMNYVIGPPSTFSAMAVRISSRHFRNNCKLTYIPPISELAKNLPCTITDLNGI